MLPAEGTPQAQLIAAAAIDVLADLDNGEEVMQQVRRVSCCSRSPLHSPSFGSNARLRRQSGAKRCVLAKNLRDLSELPLFSCAVFDLILRCEQVPPAFRRGRWS